MNKAPIGPKAVGPPQSIQAAPRDKERVSPERETLSLSPERVARGRSTTTTVLQEILDRAEKPPHLRHWGINE